MYVCMSVFIYLLVYYNLQINTQIGKMKQSLSLIVIKKELKIDQLHN